MRKSSLEFEASKTTYKNARYIIELHMKQLTL